MPFYNTLNPSLPEDRRTADGLLRLKEGLSSVPAKTLDDTLLLATWNIREFGDDGKGGKRSREALFYMSEIISRFDLVAVQEVRKDMGDMDALLMLLGSSWKYLVTDVTYGVQGNNERVAFLYDSRKLSFGGLVGELVPEGKAKGDNATPFYRSPFLAGFRAGWFKFTICSTHLAYAGSKPDVPQRVKEMKNLIRLMKKMLEAKTRWARNAVILGDFNVFHALPLKDPTFAAMELAFTAVAKDAGSNADKSKPYDQIAFLSPDVGNQLATATSGVFDFFEHVYRMTDEDRAAYEAEWTGFRKGKPEAIYKEWRTFRMSDHLPKWVEVKIDFSRDYLGLKKKVSSPAPDTRAFTAGSGSSKSAKTKKVP